jgi:OOP family OmpA-OmpF porin
MVRKIIVIAVCFAAIITRAGAQGLSIELNGGLQGTQYQLQNGQSKQLPGGSLGLLYTFRLGSQWGLVTGITGGLYRTQATLQDGVVFTSYQVDDQGSAFQYNLKATGYKETQQFFAAGIPLMLQYHTAGAGMQWYFNGGGKVLFPSNASIQASAQQLSLSGYYPDYNLDISNLPQHGFGTIKNWSSSTTTQLKPAAALSVATGISFGVSPGTRLYTGLYVDYGLTSLKNGNGAMPLATYSSTGISGVQANSVLNMQIAGQMTLLSFGLQVRLSFGSARSKPAAQPDTNVVPQQLVNPIVIDDTIDFIQRPVVFGIFGESAIPEVQKPHLDQVADLLKQFPTMRISIEGHVCDEGTAPENIKVGADRAKAVARYLQDKGIARNRMDVRSASQSDPVLPNDYDANFQNRRVVITVIQ